MTRRFVRGLGVALAVAAALALAAGDVRAQAAGQRPGAPVAPRRDTQKAPEGTGAIRGQVFASDMNAPLRRARVRLTSPELQITRTATTDAEGRFEFKKLPAGRFNLNASKGSYIALDYGQRRPFERGKPVELGAGQVLEKVNFTLPPGCVITGRVTDDYGDPVADIQVSAMRLQYSDGRRRAVPFGRMASTNDTGAFRLYGLPPGDFYVGTVFSMGGTMGGADSEEGFVYAPTYYPGTASLSEAGRVTLKLGQERSNVDLTLVSSRTASVSGTAFTSKGVPAVGATITLTQTLSSGSAGGGMMVTRSSMSGSGASVQADGSFKITGLAPGEYELSLSVNNAETGEEEAASVPITMNGVDITGVSLLVTPGHALRGTIVFEGGEPTFAPRILRASGLTPGGTIGPVRFSTLRATTVRDDWSVEVKGLDGPRLIRLTGLPPEWMLKGIYQEGRDLTDTPVDFSADLEGVQFVVTNAVTRLVGTVADEKGEAVREYSVLIFPEDSARWTPLSRFRTVARPDQHGEFKAEKLPAGDYLAVALEYLDEGDASDPEFLSRMRDHATRFSLGEAEVKTLALKLTVVER